jgi:hypothetical protein
MLGLDEIDVRGDVGLMSKGSQEAELPVDAREKR